MNLEKFNSTFDYFQLCKNETLITNPYFEIKDKENNVIVKIFYEIKCIQVLDNVFLAQVEWDEIVYIIHKIESLTKQITMIKIQIIGTLGADCSIQMYQEKRVINFSIAVNNKWVTKDGEVKESTTWINCSYWNEKSKITDYLKKGTKVFLEGKPEPILYSDSKGEKQVSLSVTVNEIQLITSKSNEDAKENSAKKIRKIIEFDNENNLKQHKKLQITIQ